MSPPELVVLFADADAERFVSTLIERGIERGCLRPCRWEPVRDPMKDPRVAREPQVALGPYLMQPGVRYLILWDHVGSGFEEREAADVEQRVVDALKRAGVAPERVAAMAFTPELEAVFEPVWDRVLELLAHKRNHTLKSVPFQIADPKASFHEAVTEYRLRPDAALFRELAGALSVPQLKLGTGLARVADRLVAWFGAT